MSTTAKSAAQFRLLGDSADIDFAWQIKAVGRACASRFLGVAADCNKHTTTLSSTGGTYHLHGVRNEAQVERAAGSPTGCADPFAWYSQGAASYFLTCTGGELPLMQSAQLGPATVFSVVGDDLAGTPAAWAKAGNRWAPENVEITGAEAGGSKAVTDTAPDANVMFFSDEQAGDGRHRVGWAASSRDTYAMASSWRKYSERPLDLGQSAGGEIDQVSVAWFEPANLDSR